MSRRTAEPLAAGLAALAALAVALLVPTYPNYDAYYHLVWARELLDGLKPSFEAYQAPTQHPLYLALCALLVPLGQDADRLLVLTCVVAFVALAWAVFRVGDAVFGPWPGLAAAAFVASSFAFLLYAARAYVDVPFLAVVLWAAAIEARTPRRGWPVMALLAVAGLLRPEAWVLAGAYWLWCARREAPRLDLLALALAPPVIWALVDLWATGDPLHSLHATSDLADELGRERGVAKVPGAFVRYLADTARPPVVLAALAGAVLAWRLRAGRSLHVVVGLLGAGALTFLLSGAAGLSILPRYLTVPAVGLCLLAGYGLLGFTTLPPGTPERRLWSRVAAVLLVAGLAFVVARAGVVDRLVAELRFIRSTHDDLVAILHTPQAAHGMACGPVTFPNYRLVPDTRWILDLPRGRVGARSARRRTRGAAIFVVGRKALQRYGFADGASPSTNVPDPGFVRAVRRGAFVAYSAC
jgi:hypothetical protein